MRRQLVIFTACVLTGGAIAGCSDESPPPGAPAGKVQAVATIFPLADAVRQLGGQQVEVACLLEPGQSPHDFEPKARHAELLKRARLVVMIGLGVDDWAMPAVEGAGAKEAAILKLSEDPQFKKDLRALATRPGDAHQGGADPHVWLDPVFMQRFAAAIAEALIRVDPDHRQNYLRRRDAFVDELKRLDEEYRSTLAGVKHKHFVTFHPAFSYVAERYGLVQMSLHTPDAGGFGGDRLEKVVAFVKAHKVKAIFAEPQFPAERLRALGEQTGAKVATLDPLGNPATGGYDGYLAMMRSNLRALAAALKE